MHRTKYAVSVIVSCTLYTHPRRKKNYELADSIEDDLNSAGIHLDSKMHFSALTPHPAPFTHAYTHTHLPLFSCFSSQVNNITLHIDRENSWRAYDGSISGFQSSDSIRHAGQPSEDRRLRPCTLTQTEAQALVEERAVARSSRDFSLAGSNTKSTDPLHPWTNLLNYSCIQS